MIGKLSAVALGGAIGALARYGLTKGLGHLDPHQAFHVGTLTANLTGCILMGVLVVWTGQLNELYREILSAFLLVGILGSLTTFSTYMLEAFQLAQEGQAKLLMAHSVGHLVIGFLGLWLGYSAAHRLWPATL